MRAVTPSAPASPAKTIHPPSISLRELWPWALFAGAFLLGLLFFVAVDGGATALGRGGFLHEFVHDGRHFLAYPCH